MQQTFMSHSFWGLGIGKQRSSVVLAQVQSSEGLMGLGELLAADLLRWPLAGGPPSLPCGSLLECLLSQHPEWWPQRARRKPRCFFKCSTLGSLNTCPWSLILVTCVIFSLLEVSYRGESLDSTFEEKHIKQFVNIFLKLPHRSGILKRKGSEREIRWLGFQTQLCCLIPKRLWGQDFSSQTSVSSGKIGVIKLQFTSQCYKGGSKRWHPGGLCKL